jgi:hypothetical protein
MRIMSLKHGWLVPHASEAESAPGRTIYPEPMRMAEPGWAREAWQGGETVMRRMWRAGGLTRSTEGKGALCAADGSLCRRDAKGRLACGRAAQAALTDRTNVTSGLSRATRLRGNRTTNNPGT